MARGVRWSMACCVVSFAALGTPTSTASAQSAVAPVEHEEPPRRTKDAADEAPWVEGQRSGGKRRRGVVIRDEGPDEDEEYYDPREAERRRHQGYYTAKDGEPPAGSGGGASARDVGLVLTISGLAVGLAGGGLLLAGSISEDRPTMITGAVVGFAGTALSVTGLIVNLTAGPSRRALAEPIHLAAPAPSVVLGVGPTSAVLSASW